MNCNFAMGTHGSCPHHPQQGQETANISIKTDKELWGMGEIIAWYLAKQPDGGKKIMDKIVQQALQIEERKKRGK